MASRDIHAHTLMNPWMVINIELFDQCDGSGFVLALEHPTREKTVVAVPHRLADGLIEAIQKSRVRLARRRDESSRQIAEPDIDFRR